MGAQGGEDVVEAALVEFVAACLPPPVGEIGACPVDGFGDLGQMLLGVEDVDDLDGAGGVLVGPVPDPRGAVAEDDAARRRGEASASGLARGARAAKGDGAVRVPASVGSGSTTANSSSATSRPSASAWRSADLASMSSPASSRSSSLVSPKLTRAAARPVMRRAAADREVPSRPSARSRGAKPAPQRLQCTRRAPARARPAPW